MLTKHNFRLKNYDYSQSGLYFVTICVQDRLCLFGHITEGKMILNPAGLMLEKWYKKISIKFSNIDCLDMVVMPNHFHCIWHITDNTATQARLHLLATVVHWFKTMTTNDYIKNVNTNNWRRFNKRLWQHGYYEHIIRNEKAYEGIANYILYNPELWLQDDLYIATNDINQP